MHLLIQVFKHLEYARHWLHAENKTDVYSFVYPLPFQTCPKSLEKHKWSVSS